MENFLNWLEESFPILYDITRELINKAVRLGSLSEIQFSSDFRSIFGPSLDINYTPLAVYDNKNKVITVNKEQAYTSALTYIIVEIHNALNEDANNIKYENFSDEHRYALAKEQAEFYFTYKPTTELIYKYLLKHESEAKKFFYSTELYLLNEYKLSSEISFEASLEDNKPHTELYRQQYINYSKEGNSVQPNIDNFGGSVVDPTTIASTLGENKDIGSAE